MPFEVEVLEASRTCPFRTRWTVSVQGPLASFEAQKGGEPRRARPCGGASPAPPLRRPGFRGGPVVGPGPGLRGPSPDLPLLPPAEGRGGGDAPAAGGGGVPPPSRER